MKREESAAIPRYRICVVNGVFVSGGIGADGRVRPPGLFNALASELASATGFPAWALWPFISKRVFGISAFLTMTRGAVERYAAYLASCVREDLAANPLQPGESLAFVAYSGGTPVVQTAATLLRDALPIGAFVFFGPALVPRLVPPDWAGDAAVGCVVGERDWIQGVFPRVPRPWRAELGPRTRERLLSHVPPWTAVRTVPCDHWPGYFTHETRPLVVSAIADLLLQPTVHGRPVAARWSR